MSFFFNLKLQTKIINIFVHLQKDDLFLNLKVIYFEFLLLLLLRRYLFVFFENVDFLKILSEIKATSNFFFSFFSVFFFGGEDRKSLTE
jgi:hypothetical protein